MVAVLLLFALIVAVPAEAAGAKAAPLKIVAFGDSLTSGHRLASKDAYPPVRQAKLKAEGLSATVVNHGVSGDTTTRALRRLDDAPPGHPAIIMFEIGRHDAPR